MSTRISRNVERGEPLRLEIDGREVQAYPGETLATALLSAGVATFHLAGAGQPRGPYCGIGCCFQCLVRVAPGAAPVSGPWILACRTEVAHGMRVVTRQSLRDRQVFSGDGA